MTKKTNLDPHERMVRAAAQLLASGGSEAVSTRAVSAAAKVQPPAIYRQFGDMRGLLDAAASHCFAGYLATKRSRRREEDPVDDLRRGWDLHVEFGLANPEVYALMYGDPGPGREPAAVREGHAILRGLVQRIAEAGRLRVTVERAVQMMHSGCKGVTLTLIGMPEEERDLGLSQAMREVILSVIADSSKPAVNEINDELPARRAIAMKAVLGSARGLTPAELSLLSEWLDRLANSSTDPDK
jgi:AcrR family transcriptional regulator